MSIHDNLASLTERLTMHGKLRPGVIFDEPALTFSRENISVTVTGDGFLAIDWDFPSWRKQVTFHTEEVEAAACFLLDMPHHVVVRRDGTEVFGPTAKATAERIAALLEDKCGAHYDVHEVFGRSEVQYVDVVAWHLRDVSGLGCAPQAHFDSVMDAEYAAMEADDELVPVPVFS